MLRWHDKNIKSTLSNVSSALILRAMNCSKHKMTGGTNYRQHGVLKPN